MYKLLGIVGVFLALAACSSSPGKQADIGAISDLSSPQEFTDEKWTDEDEAIQVEWIASLQSDNARNIPTPIGEVNALAIASGDGDAPATLLEVYIFDIGQADSMLVVGPPPARRTLLVDLGQPLGGDMPAHLASESGASADHVYERIHEITGKREVDYFLLSHYHTDHAGRQLSESSGWGSGIVRLLSNNDYDFRVGTFIHVQDEGVQYMKPATDRKVFTTIDRKMGNWERTGKVVLFEKPVFGEGQIDLGDGVSVDILGFGGLVPDGTSAFVKAVENRADYSGYPGNENDLSIALRITAGEFELFTAGDLNGTDDPERRPYYVKREFGETYTNIEWHLVNYWDRTGTEMDVEVYRANHHGSKYSNTDKFLESLDPEVMIYSTGAQHGHPELPVVERASTTADQYATTAVKHGEQFEDLGGEVVGEISIIVPSKGQTYQINGQERTAFTDAQEMSGLDASL